MVLQVARQQAQQQVQQQAALAVLSSKLASSTPSPASARAMRMASALYSKMAWLRVLKLPVDLDIFSALSSRWPVQRTDLGHLSLLVSERVDERVMSCSDYVSPNQLSP